MRRARRKKPRKPREHSWYGKHDGSTVETNFLFLLLLKDPLKAKSLALLRRLTYKPARRRHIH